MARFGQSQVSSLSLPANSYIYSITCSSPRIDLKHDTRRELSKDDRLLLTTSADSVLALDPETLAIVPSGRIQNANKSLTVAEPYAPLGARAETVVTAGRDGAVNAWDIRAPEKPVLQIEAPGGSNDPVSALACHAGTHAIAAGTELEGNGPGDVSIYLWDTRQPQVPFRKYTESHTDTITELRFLPYPEAGPSNVLLSGSTDGLVNVFDLGVADEDDAVLQVVNHQSAIHHTGLIGEDIYALGTDEKLAFFVQQNPDPKQQDPDPYEVGDLRETVQCDYATRIRNHPHTPLIAVGNYTEPSFRLIPLKNAATGARIPVWNFDLTRAIHLDGAHGEELVRDYYVDDNSQVIFTCGEDGAVRQWRREE